MNLSRSNLRENLRLSLFILGLIIILISLVGLPRISIPFMVSYICYLIVYPAVPALEKIGLKQSWAIVTVFASVIFFTVYPFAKIVPTVTKEAENVQYYIPKVEDYVRLKYQEIRKEVKKKVGVDISGDYVNKAIKQVRTSSTNILLNIPKFVASVLEWVLLLPLFIFFFLKDGRKFKRIILDLTPNSIFERFYYVTHQFNKQLGDYIFAKFVEASIVGLIITAGLLILKVRFALLLGIIAGVSNIIPYAGPVIGFVPALLLALAEYGGGTTLGAIVLLYLIANTIDIALVFPILVSKIVDLHPIIVVLSVILGGQTLGIIGMVISIPVAAALKLILIEIYNEVYHSQ